MGIVAEVIAEYLRSNRKLIVPAFGVFMVKESGERVFSDLLSLDDGVLYSLLRNKGLNEMEAAVMTDRFIFEVRHELEQYGYCRLGEIGTLRVEPTTKVLRLYPPVQGELPKQTPYIPKQTAMQECEKARVEDVSKPQLQPQPQPTPRPTKPIAPATTPRRSAKPRKKFDFVVAVAVIIVIAALVAIGYGWYVSTLAEADDVAMDALRVLPQQINE